MRRAFKYCLYPTKEQTAALETTLETLRRLYNAALEMRKKAYEEEKKTLNRYALNRWFTTARRENEWYGKLNVSTATAAFIRLDRAFEGFFRRVKSGEKPGYPRFKGRDFFDSIEFPNVGNGWKLIEDKIRVQHVGDVKVKLHRPIEGAIKNVRLKREAGRWYVIFSCLLEDVAVQESRGEAVRLTLGNGEFLIASNGHVEPVPKYLEESLARIRRLSRSLARKSKGGKNRAKAKAALAKAHAKIANQRRDHHCQLAAKLTGEGLPLELGATEVKPIIRADGPRTQADRLFNRAVHDAAWSGFAHRLASSGEKRGVPVASAEDRAVNP